jgi:IS5 family transposase
MSFAGYYVDQRSARTSVFHNRINTPVDWVQIEKVINRYYRKGETLQGCRPYSGILLFRMLLLGIRNDLPDVNTEDHLHDSLSAMRFCGLELEDPVPGHSTLSRFRTELTRNRGMDKILSAFNRQLEKHHLTVRTGVRVDASLTESPRKPKGAVGYQIAEDRREDEVPREEQDKQKVSVRKLQGKGGGQGWPVAEKGQAHPLWLQAP